MSILFKELEIVRIQELFVLETFIMLLQQEVKTVRHIRCGEVKIYLFGNKLVGDYINFLFGLFEISGLHKSILWKAHIIYILQLLMHKETNVLV